VALEKSVNEALKAVPPEHDGASVSITSVDGIHAYLAHKIDDHWSVIAQGGLSLQGKADYGVAVHGSWTW
jgi:hypothetical protein